MNTTVNAHKVADKHQHQKQDSMSVSPSLSSHTNSLAHFPLPTVDQLEEALEERINPDRRVQLDQRHPAFDRRRYDRRRSTR